MIHIIITYSVKEKWSDYNRQLIEAFIQQLRDYSIRGAKHFVYKVGASFFIHVCRYASISLCEKAIDIPAFRYFLSKLESIVEKEPITHAVEEIGHYPE